MGKIRLTDIKPIAQGLYVENEESGCEIQALLLVTITEDDIGFDQNNFQLPTEQ